MMRRFSSVGMKSSFSGEADSLSTPGVLTLTPEPSPTPSPQLKHTQSSIAMHHKVGSQLGQSSNPPSRIAGKDGIWQQIFMEANAQASKSSKSHILLLGAQDVGKTTLIRRLQEYGARGTISEFEVYRNNNGVSALDAASIGVRRIEDEEEDMISADTESHSTIWVLQSNSQKYQALLLKRLQPSYIANMAAIICLDMGKAWYMMIELQAWLDTLLEITTALMNELPFETQDALKDKQAHYISTYKRNTHQHLTTMGLETTTSEMIANMSAQAQALSFNLGIPIIVNVCRSDMYYLYNTRETEGQIDVIEAHLRRVCLLYGAALIFSSLKNPSNPTNVLLLYRYLMHRLYGYHFRFFACTDSHGSLFFPSGFDTSKSIEDKIVNSIVGDFSKPFESIIQMPPGKEAIMRYKASEIEVDSFEKMLENFLIQDPTLAEDFQSKLGDTLSPASVMGKGVGFTKSTEAKNSFEKFDKKLSAEGSSSAVLSNEKRGSVGGRNRKASKDDGTGGHENIDNVKKRDSSDVKSSEVSSGLQVFFRDLITRQSDTRKSIPQGSDTSGSSRRPLHRERPRPPDNLSAEGASSKSERRRKSSANEETAETQPPNGRTPAAEDSKSVEE